MTEQKGKHPESLKASLQNLEGWAPLKIVKIPQRKLIRRRQNFIGRSANEPSQIAQEARRERVMEGKREREERGRERERDADGHDALRLTENFHFLSKTATNGLHSKMIWPAEKLLLAGAAATSSGAAGEPSIPLFSGASRFMVGGRDG